MNTNLDLNTGNPNFKALYMTKPYRLSGLKNMEIFDIVREPLKDIAKDVDIYVKANGFFDDGYTIKVGKVTKSPLKRFFGLIGDTINKTLKYDDRMCFNGNISDLILSTAQKAKEEYLNFKDYLTKS